MSKINVYSVGDSRRSSITFPKDMLAPENLQLLAQAIHVYRDRSHPGLAKKKTRGEVALTTKKWYRQKGTGRARHGARSAPIFVGGGVAHGPRGVKRQLSLPKKMRRKALAVSLSLKLKEKQIAAVVGLESLKSTKAAKKLFETIRKGEGISDKNARFTLVLGDKNNQIKRYIRNLSNVSITEAANLNAYQVFWGGRIIFDKQVLTKTKK